MKRNSVWVIIFAILLVLAIGIGAFLSGNGTKAEPTTVSPASTEETVSETATEVVDTNDQVMEAPTPIVVYVTPEPVETAEPTVALSEETLAVEETAEPTVESLVEGETSEGQKFVAATKEMALNWFRTELKSQNAAIKWSEVDGYYLAVAEDDKTVARVSELKAPSKGVYNRILRIGNNFCVTDTAGEVEVLDSKQVKTMSDKGVDKNLYCDQHQAIKGVAVTNKVAPKASNQVGTLDAKVANQWVAAWVLVRNAKPLVDAETGSSYSESYSIKVLTCTCGALTTAPAGGHGGHHDEPKPTSKPTEAPTAKPTEKPTEAPTAKPTEKPTEAPTAKPTEKPTEAPAHQAEQTPPPKEGYVSREEQEEDQPEHQAEQTPPSKKGTVTREEQEADSTASAETAPAHDHEKSAPPKMGAQASGTEELPPKAGTVTREEKVETKTESKEPELPENRATVSRSEEEKSSSSKEEKTAPSHGAGIVLDDQPTPKKQATSPSHGGEVEPPAMGGDKF